MVQEPGSHSCKPLKTSAHAMFANIPLATASHMAEPGVKAQGRMHYPGPGATRPD